MNEISQGICDLVWSLGKDHDARIFLLFESEVHHPAGDEHPEQTVDASPEIEEDGGQDQNDAVQQVVDKSDFHFILVLEVGDDDVRSAGRKTVVETKADAGTDDCGTDKRS